MNKSSNGVLILVLGIISWVGPSLLCAIPAWILGNQSLAMLKRGEGDPNDLGMVQAGRILGMVHCILFLVVGCVWLMIVLGVLGLIGFSAATGAH